MAQDWQAVGARSRGRGKRFEKDVADALGWSRVPFSGRNAIFGEGDVIDGFVNGAGFWLAECKMRTDTTGQGSVSVRGDWIAQAVEAAERAGRFPLVVVGIKHGRSKPEGLVFFNEESSRFLFDKVVYSRNRTHFAWAPRRWDELHLVWATTANVQGSFCLRRLLVDRTYDAWRCARVDVQHAWGFERWVVMRLSAFAELTRGLRPMAMVPGPNTTED